MSDTPVKKTKKKATSHIGRKKSPAKKQSKNTSLTHPQRSSTIRNQFVFRDQLTTNGYDLTAEIIKNIEALECPKERLEYQMRLMKYSYNELGEVQMLQPIDPSRQGGEGSQPKKDDPETIDVEFNDVIKRI